MSKPSFIFIFLTFVIVTKSKCQIPDVNGQKEFMHNPMQPQTLIQVMDSIYQWSWDTTPLTIYYNSKKTINMVYDSHNNLISHLNLITYGTTIWGTTDQYFYTYDATNKLANKIRQTWTNNAWKTFYQNTYAYNSNNDTTSKLDQVWNSITGLWENDYQYIYTYDSTNNLTSLEWIWWYYPNVIYRQYLYAYDANNNLAHDLFQTAFNGGSWGIHQQDTFIYNTNNNLISKFNQSWNGSSWDSSYLYTNTYDANNNLINELKQWWQDSVWANQYQSIYTYDVNNNRISKRDQIPWSPMWRTTDLYT